ncbi:GH92 family glycosyl hydrolase [Salana multivorans]
MIVTTGQGPQSGYSTVPGLGHGSTEATRIETPRGNRAEAVLAEGAWPVGERTRLVYRVFPELDETDLARPSTYLTVDAELDDGTRLSSLGARDQRGFMLSARGQGESEGLYPRQWNHVECDLGPVAAGRTVTRLLVTVDPPAGEAPAGEAPAGEAPAGEADDEPSDEHPVVAWLSEVQIDDGLDRIDVDNLSPLGLVDLVDTRRGTHGGPDFSRGNTLPAAAVPNGFTLVTPMTAWSRDWPYSWARHDTASGRPALRGIALAHQPSPWMGDRNQLVLAPTWHDAAGSPATRSAGFAHDDETARPYRYTVRLESGAAVETAPTDHGAIIRMTPPADAASAELRLELAAVDQDSSFQVDDVTSAVRGWVDGGSGLSVGRSRMFVVAHVEVPDGAAPAQNGGPGRAPGHRVVVVPGGEATVRVATSYLGLEQAERALDMELAGRSLEEIAASGKQRWADRLGVLSLGGARTDELRSAYGSLYRVNLYPTAHHENVGTAEAPEYAHASPVLPPVSASTDEHTGATIRPGRAYVNHGFWDTYRTVWPLYALVYPEIAGELADGFVEQFRSGGWISRWPSPGYADSMTGTSSDVAFADLAVKGVPLPDPESTYRAGLRNATALPPSPEVGRKDLREGAYRGFPSSALHEAVSWAVESALNDAALAAQAELLASRDNLDERSADRLCAEARYLRRRSLAYRTGFDAATGFFRSRTISGALAEDFDPLAWGGDYTETNAWSYAFPAPHDGAGLAALHGGPAGLGARLDEYLRTPELADRPGTYGFAIHEMAEARDVRRGQLGLSNQPAHHIPFMYAFAQRPGDASAIVRDALRRLFGGSEIGQGYPGDEDNGEMSAWYLWALTGLYPLQVGAPRYVLTAPGLPRVTWHLPEGDLVVTGSVEGSADGAVGASRTAFDDAVRIAALAVDGRSHGASWIGHEEIARGARLTAVLTSGESDWASGPEAVPPSVGDDLPGPWRDLTSGGSSPLVSDDAGTEVVALAAGACVVVDLDGDNDDGDNDDGAVHDDAGVPELYTLTCGPDPSAAPAAWLCEVSIDGETWAVVDERSEESFDWPWQLRPFAFQRPVPAGARWFRITVTAPVTAELGQLEVLA